MYVPLTDGPMKDQTWHTDLSWPRTCFVKSRSSSKSRSKIFFVHRLLLTLERTLCPKDGYYSSSEYTFCSRDSRTAVVTCRRPICSWYFSRNCWARDFHIEYRYNNQQFIFYILPQRAVNCFPKVTNSYKHGDHKQCLAVCLEFSSLLM